MTAGMAFEALNHAGGMDPEPNLLVILNDNRMSISENVGGLTKMLGRMMSSPTMNAMREGGKRTLIVPPELADGVTMWLPEVIAVNDAVTVQSPFTGPVV